MLVVMRSGIFTFIARKAQPLCVVIAAANCARAMNDAMFAPYVSLTKIFKTVKFADAFMVMRMMRTSYHQLKIIQDIVILYAIKMMNNFIFPYWSPNVCRHYQAMLGYISNTICVWVTWAFHVNISANFKHSKRIMSQTSVHINPRSFTWQT